MKVLEIKKMKYFLKYILILTLAVSFSASAQSVLKTLVGEGKKCNYVDEGLYMPFSDINDQFPVFGAMVRGECVDVKSPVTDMFLYGFKVFLGLVSIIAVINISVAGIQYMIQEKDTSKLRGAKKRLTQSIVGLILAISGFLILNGVNTKLTDIGIDFSNNPLSDMIQRGAQMVENIAPVAGAGDCIVGTAGCTDAGTPSIGKTPGTGDATGAITPASAPTIFGYKDGNGYAGSAGDNGLGNAAWSPVRGWTYYNGGAHNPAGIASAYSQGVALPQSTLIRDFGSAENVKNGAYEIFVGGKSIGAFPVVDNSSSKFDLTYGLVKTHIDPKVTSSNTWSGAGKNITYKPLPNYWNSHPRPKNPMVLDNFKQSNPSANTVDAAVTNPNTFKVQ